MFRVLISLTIVFAINLTGKAQTLVFAELTGNPLNTIGWNLTGNAYVGDTPGDGDNFNDELILTNASNGQSGGVFFQSPIDLNTCQQWQVEFQFRIWEGSGADGIAFCFIDVPPTGFVSGGGVGIPQSANGIKVVFDTYDNGCGANPEIQIYNGVGYNECIAGIVKVNNSGGNLNFIRSNGYNNARITYNNGVITVFVNNVQWLSTTYNVTFVGYMGFTASTGGSNDRHSIKNARIFADVAEANAGADITICSGQTGQIGSANNSNYVYTWSPANGLSSSTVSNPSVSLTNSGNSNLTQTYTVQTNLASNPNSCPVFDQVSVTVKPNHVYNINSTLCQGESISAGGQNFSATGIYQVVIPAQNGCDSTIHVNLTVNPVYSQNINVTLCQGESYVFGSQTLTASGIYQRDLQTINGCDSIITLNLVVNPTNTSSLIASICQGETYPFFGNNLSNPGIYSQQLQNIYGCDSSVTLTLTLKPTLSGTVNHSMCQGESFLFNGQNYSIQGVYTATLTGSNGCDSIVTLNLTVYPIPAAPQLTSNAPLECPGDELTINAEFFDGATYTWTGPNNFVSTTQNVSFNAFVPNIGNYGVRVTINGCISPEATIGVDILNIFTFEDFQFPNVITPNSDGVNDAIDIKVYYQTCFRFELQLFNRWGNLVFSQDFDGQPFMGETNEGKPLPDGVYFYRLKYEGSEKNGFVQILRRK
jgi:gliding motility-associated-like protein